MINAKQAERLAADFADDAVPYLLTTILREVETVARAGNYSTMISDETDPAVIKELEALGFMVTESTLHKEISWGSDPK
jgi:hypothetical protein